MSSISRQLGTSTAEAFRMFVRKSIAENGFPFSLTLDDNPSPATLDSYREADELAREHKVQRYQNFDQMLAE